MVLTSSLTLIEAKDKDETTAPLKVMSFNIRNAKAKDGTNSWQYRFPGTALMIKDEMPDILAMQEPLYPQVQFILDNFSDYKMIGKGREDGKKEGEFTAIFYNKKKISCIKSGVFWLSENSKKPSKGWDAFCKRTATWAIMSHKDTKERFFVLNTHLDHVGSKARQYGLALVLKKIKQINKDNYPVILTGDFNVQPGNKCLKQIDSSMHNARKEALKTDNHCSFHEWGRKHEVIDYIYYSGIDTCLEFRTVTKKYGDWNFISDHYPIVALFDLADCSKEQ